MDERKILAAILTVAYHAEANRRGDIKPTDVVNNYEAILQLLNKKKKD